LEPAGFNAYKILPGEGNGPEMMEPCGKPGQLPQTPSITGAVTGAEEIRYH